MHVVGARTRPEESMVKALFAPAHWVLGHVPSTVAFLFGCVLFLAPAGVALFGHGAMPREVLYAVVGGLSLIAVYGLIAMRTYAATDIAQIVRITDRLASGELIDNVRSVAAGTGDAGRLW